MKNEELARKECVARGLTEPHVIRKKWYGRRGDESHALAFTNAAIMLDKQRRGKRVTG